jgi:hypothetical protein
MPTEGKQPPEPQGLKAVINPDLKFVSSEAMISELRSRYREGIVIGIEWHSGSEGYQRWWMYEGSPSTAYGIAQRIDRWVQREVDRVDSRR